MKIRTAVLGALLGGGCLPLELDSCEELICAPGSSCSELEGAPQCVLTCGNGIIDENFDEVCDSTAPGGGGSACNEVCEVATSLGCGDKVPDFDSFCLRPGEQIPLVGKLDGGFFAEDIDGDEDIDLVARIEVEGAHQIQVLLGEQASFLTSSVFESERFLERLVDLNQDGRLDLVMSLEGSLSVFLQSNAGSFTESTTVEVGDGGLLSPEPRRLFLEVNGDGFVDLLSLLPGGGLGVFLNDGAGGFLAPQPISGASRLLEKSLTQDWDGDGDLDVIALSGSTTLSLLQNEGGVLSLSASLGALESSTLFGSKLDARDWDSDGDPDLMVGENTGQVRLFVNEGSSFTERAVLTAEEDLVNGAAGDINGDEHPDLVLLFGGSDLQTSRAFSILENNGAGEFTEVLSQEIDLSRLMRVEDLNGDGRADIRFLDDIADAILLADPQGVVSAPRFVGTVLGDRYLDLNGDRFLDVLLEIDNQLEVHLGGPD